MHDSFIRYVLHKAIKNQTKVDLLLQIQSVLSIGDFLT